MKPQFALILSSDGVALLHRQKRGWEELGSVAPDDPKFKSKLSEIRERALERSPGGIETKLVLPESQVLYTSIASPGRDDATRREAVRRALEGMTPYPVDDLAFDYEAEGEVLHIAVVARETLDEAEDFAAEHRLNPVSVVARLAGGSFTSEPFFGETTSAAAILPEGVRVERDVLPTQVTLKLTQPVVPPPADRQAAAGGAVAGAFAGAAGAAEAAAAAPQIRVFYEDDALPLAPAPVPSAAPQDAAEQAAAFLPADAEGEIHPDAGEDLGAEPGPAGSPPEADDPAGNDAVAALPEDVDADSDPDDVGLGTEEAEVAAAREDDAGHDTPAGDEAMPAPEDEDAVALVAATPVGIDEPPHLDGDRLAPEEAEALAAAEDEATLRATTEEDAIAEHEASGVHGDGLPDLGDDRLEPEEAVAAPEDDARHETATVHEAAHAPEDENAVAEEPAAPDLGDEAPDPGEDALALDGVPVDAAAVAPPPADEEAHVADEAA
ncbi:MAG: hypothetical protein MUE98_07825, partial [Rhodobacteraceae bacterium]|nr:hypothetical protein [Paracoccaceae bacterium]